MISALKLNNGVDDSPSMSTIEASAYTGRTPATLKTYRCRKRGPAFYRGLNSKAILYRRADLDAWLAVQRIDFQSDTNPA